MFTPGRYVVVDDQRDELRILVEALHGIGAPCVGVHYTGRPLDPASFAGVRVLFSDLYLLAAGNERQQFGAIEALLRTNVDPTKGGPYILVIWTSHEEQVGGLRAYLHERLEVEKRPLAILGLDKKEYLVEGALAKPGELAQAIADRVNASPQIRALISWEADVLAAAGATLAQVTELVPAKERDVADFNNKLDGVLSQLAVAAVGAPNVAIDRRAAINAALAPILADRIVNAPPGPDAGVWNAAITREQNLPPIDSAQSGRMNRMLHLSLPGGGEVIKATDWGAVLKLPAEAIEEEASLAMFGVQFTTILADEFKIKAAAHGACTPVVVRIGAACDHAQRKPGPLPYVLGLLVPDAPKYSRPKAVVEGPVFVLGEEQGPVKLLVNARFQITMVEPPATWTPLFRIREQLLMMIAAHVAEYTTRPGILEFRP